MITNDNTYLNRSCANEGRDGAQSVSQVPANSPLHSRSTLYQPSPSELLALGVSQAQVDGSINSETGGSDEEIVDSGGNPVGDPEDAAGADVESCETNGGEFSFGICPLLRLANEGVQAFDSQIRSRLQVDPGFYSDESALRDIWGRLRNVAFALLIPIVLLLVIGTALGYGFIDAYTVKRAMPRLLFAVIFMALSYDIGGIMIDLSNAATRGVQGLMVSAIVEDDCAGVECVSLSNLFDPGAAEGGALIAGGIVGGALLYGAGALSIGILLSFLGSAVMGLLIIFVVLLLRQLIIVLILAMLPFAILSWIFPGNDKLWKLTWNTFTGLLYAGPIFAAFVIFGRILAYIVNATTSTQETLGPLSYVMLVGVKLVLIVFSMVGGLFIMQRFAGAAGNVLGMVNDRGKGLFDRNKQLRSNIRKSNAEKIDKNARYGEKVLGSKALASWGNSFSRQVRYAPKAAQNGGWRNINKFRGTQRANLENLSKARIEELSQDKESSILLDWDNGAAAFAEMLAMGITSRSEMKNFIDNDTDRFGGMSERDKNTFIAQMQSFRDKSGDDRIAGMALVKALTTGGATDYQDEAGIAKIMALGAHFAGDSGALKANFDGNIGSWLTAGGRAADAAGGSYGDRAARTSDAQAMIDRHSMQAIFGQGDRGEAGRAADRELSGIGAAVVTDTLLHQDPRLMTDSRTKPYAVENLMSRANTLLQNTASQITEQQTIIANTASTPQQVQDATSELARLQRASMGVTSTLAKLDTYFKPYANANITAEIEEGMSAPVLDIRRAPAPGSTQATPSLGSVRARVNAEQPEFTRQMGDRFNPNDPLNAGRDQGGPGGPGADGP